MPHTVDNLHSSYPQIKHMPHEYLCVPNVFFADLYTSLNLMFTHCNPKSMVTKQQINSYFLLRYSPISAQAASMLNFLHHTHAHTHTRTHTHTHAHTHAHTCTHTHTCTHIHTHAHTHTHIHTHKHKTCRAPLNEWSARRRGRYLHYTQQT